MSDDDFWTNDSFATVAPSSYSYYSYTYSYANCISALETDDDVAREACDIAHGIGHLFAIIAAVCAVIFLCIVVGSCYLCTCCYWVRRNLLAMPAAHVPADLLNRLQNLLIENKIARTDPKKALLVLVTFLGTKQ